MFRYALTVILAIVAMFCSTALQADDGTEEYIGPQLLFSPPEFLSLESVDLSVGDDQVRVEYVIKNTSDKDWSGEMSFNIPERSWYGYVKWYSNRGFYDLTVRVNGRSLDYDRRAISHIDGLDVSQKLAEAGLDPNCVDLDEYELAERLPELTPQNLNKYQALDEAGLIYLYLEPVTTMEKLWFQPRWSTANIYSWPQVFPAGALTTIAYSYKPLPGVDRFSVEYKHLPPYFLEESGYDSLEALMAEVGTSWSGMEKWLSTEGDSYGFEWLTFPLNKIEWANSTGRLHLQVRRDDSFSANKVSMICLKDRQFIGQPEIDLKLDNVDIRKPLVLWRFWPMR